MRGSHLPHRSCQSFVGRSNSGQIIKSWYLLILVIARGSDYRRLYQHQRLHGQVNVLAIPNRPAN
jgi:hypothetical protein